ncbi:ImmA/IrrE family metallo-endopeptidase [Neobacillus sp.]|uniref:ImmA/IrrE family metallo-endopeptidase n=1 Tax=Neobacillus sp. TaxID=2675273 RepID=UPI0035B56437
MVWEKKIEEARRFFGIDDYPGNLFNFLGKKEVIDEHKLLLFKQDLDKLSGFIGYSYGYTIICINYKRNIGHQNFTLAHEIGHMFLHNGISKSYLNPERPGNDKEELEANFFASELIYPQKFVNQDLKYALKKNLFHRDNWDELSIYINSLCEKYFTSFKFAFNKMSNDYFRNYRKKEAFYTEFKKHIGNLSDVFPKHMHIVDYNHEYYQVNAEPYNYMKELIKELIDKKQLGLETGESIIERYEKLGGNH